ncbi:hypothetical protein EDB60_102283 [Vibrio crassostreae]|nr:hypothetical protein EDB33_101516 [Vibrio crassostreae]ROP26217.1 hypothetical protein EDB34_101516 [Vibrio crassostreae]ROR69707.1 hypothetical protein EDB59_0346 [Vibrio crassostreae]RPF00786.1 hypothetical protein EDB15_101516 [Vibrio crassostreae]RPF10684.1 hypothetical protein EDB14_1775 [Vibrio crassostreae]
MKGKYVKQPSLMTGDGCLALFSEHENLNRLS